MRHWLLTSTTYGTWLPGDARGFVGRVWESRQDDPDREALRQNHNRPGTEYDVAIGGLAQASVERMKGEPIYLDAGQAQVVLAQFQETANYRGWTLQAASVMANHFHLVVSADDLVQSEDLLRDFKSYASRRLNERYGKPANGTWWTSKGSKRPIRLDGDGLVRPICYVLDQKGFLCRWLNPELGTIEGYLRQHGKQAGDTGSEGAG